MNWFDIVLIVVILFLILTDLTKVLLSFVWLKISSFGWLYDGWRNKDLQKAKLGDAHGIPSYYPRMSNQLSLGMPRVASPLSSNDHRYFTWSYIFIRHMIYVFLGASCMIWVFACFILCLKSSILAGQTFFREPKIMICLLLCFTLIFSAMELL